MNEGDYPKPMSAMPSSALMSEGNRNLVNSFINRSDVQGTAFRPSPGSIHMNPPVQSPHLLHTGGIASYPSATSAGFMRHPGMPGMAQPI
jgi:hypothetical protein